MSERRDDPRRARRDHDDPDLDPRVPPEEWVVWPVSDVSEWGQHPLPTYEDEGDLGDGCDPPPDGPLPDEA